MKVSVTHALKDLLKELGGKFSIFGSSKCGIRYGSEDGLAKLLIALRDAGFAMAGGAAGWPPAAVFEELRSRGKTHGQFFEITWRSPHDPVMTLK